MNKTGNKNRNVQPKIPCTEKGGVFFVFIEEKSKKELKINSFYDMLSKAFVKTFYKAKLATKTWRLEKHFS